MTDSSYNLFDMMCYQHQGRCVPGPLLAAGQPVDKAKEIFTGDGVESRARFIENQQPGAGHQSAADEHARPFAPGEHQPGPLGQKFAPDLPKNRERFLPIRNASSGSQGRFSLTGGDQTASFACALFNLRTLLFGACMALPFTLPHTASANELGSLYDPSHASFLSDTGIERFGPKASGIRYDSRMIHAAEIAEQRAHKHSLGSCWRYVKTALLAANVVQSYPKTAYAKQAGNELTQAHGFRKLSICDPSKAPIGSVLVYGGGGAGHVEIRTSAGYVSDFHSATPSKRPLLGIYVKPS
jgi:hypothetical protein